MNKYGARRTWSELCQRMFDSRAEAEYGENLHLQQKVGLISDLEYQVKYVLSENPKVSIKIDFVYRQRETGTPHYEDVKGVLTRDFRTKLAWLKHTQGIDVKLIRKGE